VRVVLGCSLGGAGHLTPVLAVARALRRLGHEPVVLVPPSLAGAAAASGIEVAVGRQPPQAVIDALWQRVREGPADAVRGLIDRELFAQRAADEMGEAARELCDRVRPGLVVRESCEYATAFAAHRAGIGQLQLGISQSGIDHGVFRDVCDVLEDRAPGIAGTIEAAPYLTSFPASLDPDAWPRTQRFRPPSPPATPLPEWWPGDRRPLVYLTFGSVLGHLDGARQVYRTALDAVGELDARVLLTVGRATDPGALGPIPANVHVERWVAQHDVVPEAALVVCHGGSGTVFGALAAGVPVVVCPLFADQGANGALVERAGAGVVYSPAEQARGGLAGLGRADAAPLRELVAATLGAARHRAAARRIAGEIAGTPTLDEVLAPAIAAPPPSR